MNGGWHPAAAVSAMLARQHAAPREWMTPAQFSAWADGIAPPFTRGDPLADLVGLSKAAVRDRRRGLVAVSKTEALACAHISLGLPLPESLVRARHPEDLTQAFGAWFAERFGLAAQITAWLELRQGYISTRLRGFEVRDGERVPRLPDIALLRALDWVDRVGPLVPWPVA